ncbi:uncharacterized protein LOC128957771 [Oppia nitens]|uniref:uncharacterized protein LOC128957771 n=1 Tax=Oppia nitens TaxID=1686743 RepID=UPI0023DAFFD1|nr:uncharacterized protein LOC128957771 [Oppia nitens]
MSDIISCSSVCESVAPNGIYRGSRMYRHWYMISGKSDKNWYFTEKLVLYTRVNTTTTHQWKLIINETTISVNESTFKSLDTPIINRFDGIFRFRVILSLVEDHECSYNCYTTFTDPNDNDSKLIINCQLPHHHPEYQNTFDFQYPPNAIIFSPRVVKWTQELDLTYHMVYDKRNNKCVKLFHYNDIRLSEMGCNDCKELQCKRPIFLDQLNQQLHQSLESIVDYGNNSYILLFVINGRPLYCWQLQDQQLNETCKSSKTMLKFLPNCFNNTDIITKDEIDITMYVIILIVLVIIAVIFAVIDIVLIGKRYRQQQCIIGRQQWSTEEQTITTKMIILISMSDNISCNSLCESVAPNSIYRGSRMYRHWWTVKTDKQWHLDKLMLYTRVGSTTTHEWQLISNKTSISVNESTFKSLDKPIINRFSAIFKLPFPVEMENTYNCYTTFTVNFDPNSSGSKLITNCQLSYKYENYRNTFDIQYPTNAIIFSPRVVKWTKELDLTYHMIYDKHNNICVKLFQIEMIYSEIKLWEKKCNDCKEPKCKQPIFLDQLNQQLHQSLESIVDYGSETTC